jgi:hypothetical protein
MRNSAHPADLEWHQKELALKDAQFERNLHIFLRSEGRDQLKALKANARTIWLKLKPLTG